MTCKGRCQLDDQYHSMHGVQVRLLTQIRLPQPPWSSSRAGRASSDASTAGQTSTGDIQVPLLHFKQDAFNFIKSHLGSPSQDTGDSVMATISCLLLLEAASCEVRIPCLWPRPRRPPSMLDLTSTDKPGCPISCGYARKWACNGGKPLLGPSGHRRTDHITKVPWDVSEAVVTAPTARARLTGIGRPGQLVVSPGMMYGSSCPPRSAVSTNALCAACYSLVCRPCQQTHGGVWTRTSPPIQIADPPAS